MNTLVSSRFSSPQRASSAGVGERIRRACATIACTGACAFATVASAPGYASDPVSDPASDPKQGEVNVTDYGVVDINVQNTALTSVLEMLAYDSRRNIIVGRNVSGNISVNLFDVTFQEALTAILEPNGYGFMEDGNFIYVMTKQEIKQIEDARRQTESRIYELDYLSATDAYDLILPALSEDGEASYRGDVSPGIKSDINNVGADGYAFGVKLIINDYPENLDNIAQILAELDQPPKQVLIEATILQTTLDESNAFGVDFSVVGSMDFTNLANPLAGVNSLLNGNDADNGFQPTDNRAWAAGGTPGNTSGPGTFKVGVINDEFSVFLKLLDEVTDSTVLARPRIMALNRQKAEVLVGARIGYLSTTATETSTTQTVEFLDTGIQLVFRPFISSDGSIRMELAPSVSEALPKTITSAAGLLVTIPDQLTNELTTNVRVQDGQTLVLGGLFRESTRVTRRQVPVLGDIPIIGAAFRGQEDSVGREEIIFLITPNIVHDDMLAKLGREMQDQIDYAVVGSRAGLLPFGRSTLTRNYNQQAAEAYAAGDVDLALYYTNTSLRLHGSQPEMVEFREQLTGAKQSSHEHSILQRIYNKHVAGPADPDHPRAARRPTPGVQSRAFASLPDNTPVDEFAGGGGDASANADGSSDDGAGGASDSVASSKGMDQPADGAAAEHDVQWNDVAGDVAMREAFAADVEWMDESPAFGGFGPMVYLRPVWNWFDVGPDADGTFRDDSQVVGASVDDAHDQ